MSTAPRWSSRAQRYSVLGLEMAMRTRAMMATGTLTQKIARQVHWVR